MPSPNPGGLVDFVVVHLARWFGPVEHFPLMQFPRQLRLVQRFVAHRADYEEEYYGYFTSLGIEIAPLQYPFKLAFINDMLDAWGYPTQTHWTSEFFADYLDNGFNMWIPGPFELVATVNLVTVLFFPLYSITGMVLLEMQRMMTIRQMIDFYNAGKGGAGGLVG